MRIAHKINIVDRPDNELKTHKKPIPYLGGLAIFIGIIGALLLAQFQFGFEMKLLLPIAIGMFSIMLLGLLDDIFNIKQNYKFVIQIIIGIFFVFFCLQIGTIPFLSVAIVLSVFYIVGACNALNLLDGLDGLASGNSGISALFFVILFFIKQDSFGLVLSVALLGACLAFLIYNFEPAKIFMGDAGSMLLGFVLAILMIRYSSKPYKILDFISPILICGVPIFDTGITYLRRFLNKKPIFPGDRSHFYDQLIDRGFSVKHTVLISYAIGIIFGIVSVIISFIPLIPALLIVSVFLFILAIVIVKMKLLKIVTQKQ